MLEIAVNAWQRVACLNLVGGLRGDARLMRKALKVLEAIEFSEDEKKEIGLTDTDRGPGWNQAKAKDKVYILRVPDVEAAELLRQTIKTHSDWPAISARDVLSLRDKLGIQDEPEPQVEMPKSGIPA